MRTQLAVALREMARPAGFEIEVQTMPHATYLDQVWRKGSFYIGFYNMQATADGIFSLLYTSNAAWNETRWNNAEFDRLVEGARTTVDDGAAAGALRAGPAADEPRRALHHPRLLRPAGGTVAAMCRATACIRAARCSAWIMSGSATARRGAAERACPAATFSAAAG